MPKTTIEAHEIIKPKLNFVSLVHRGANQIPIRIMKQEDKPMIDVHARFRAMFKKAEKSPEVIGIVVKSDMPDEHITSALKAANIERDSVIKSETEDGITTFTKGEIPSEGLMIVQSPNDIGILVSNVKKGFDSWLSEEVGFADKARADGFYPSLYNSVDVLAEYLCDHLRQAENPAQAAELLGAAVDEFKQYIQGIVADLPETAFYVDRYAALAKTEMAKSEASTDSAPEQAFPSTETAEIIVETTDVVEKANDEDKEDKKKEKAEEEEEVEKEDETTNSETIDLLKQLVKGNENLTNAIMAIATKLDANLENVQKAVADNTAAVESKLQDFDARLKKTDAAISGTVFNQTRDDKIRLEKTSPILNLAPLDTAYNNTA